MPPRRAPRGRAKASTATAGERSFSSGAGAGFCRQLSLPQMEDKSTSRVQVSSASASSKSSRGSSRARRSSSSGSSGRHIGEHNQQIEKEELDRWKSRRKIRFEDEKPSEKPAGRRRSSSRRHSSGGGNNPAAAETPELETALAGLQKMLTARSESR
eukprot:SAG31_NODE_4572_length_3127_cov_1.044914_3_plen_157_part_00